MATVDLTPWISRAQEGDPKAMSQLAEAIRPLIARQLVRYPLSDEDRHDVLQSALLQVVRRLDSFRGSADFRTWLFRVAANEALMLMRSQRRHRAHVVTDGDVEDLSANGLLPLQTQQEPADSHAMQGERDSHVQFALAQLPEHYREVVTAHYHQDLNLHEIAERLQVTESAVRSRLHRARSRLRSLLSLNDESSLSEEPVELAA